MVRRNETENFSILLSTADKYPIYRVDVAVLFGQELGARGHTVDLVAQSEGQCQKSYNDTWGAGRVWVGKTDLGEDWLGRLKKHAYGLLHAVKIFKLAKQGEYDFIQVKDQFFVAFMAILAARLTRKKFTYWLSYPFPEGSLYKSTLPDARYPLFYKVRGMINGILLYKVIMPLADYVFVQSEQMRKDMVSKGVNPEKLMSVPMGVEKSGLPDICAGGGRAIPEGEEAVVYLGTLIRQRKMDFVVRVFAMVKEKHPKAKMYFVGDGADSEDLSTIISEAKKLGVDEDVVITGFMPQEEAFKYVCDASVCLSPFYPMPILNSTSPTKLVEYMALGKAVVANDHPEQKLVLEESGAGICVPYDEKEFSKAIMYILDHRDEAEKMGERGKLYVEECRTYEKIADNVEAKYRCLLNSSCT